MRTELFEADLIDLIPKMRAYARALTRDATECDDLVQETLAKALKNHHRFQQGTQLRAWLFTIMRNTFYTSITKRQREMPGMTDCVSGTVAVDPIHDAVITHKQVLAAISSLPRQYREMLVLVIMLGESYEDAAKICNCAVGTVKSRVNRGRQMVMKSLEDYSPQSQPTKQPCIHVR